MRISILTNRGYNPWLFSVVLLACFIVSAEVRYQQLETWEKTPSAYFVGARPMMTTLDAPYYLRLARKYNERSFGKDTLRSYPSQSEKFHTMSTNPNFIDDAAPSSKENSKFKYYEVPLLSFIVAHLAPIFNNNYYLTGTLIIPVLASLFIVPMGIYFFNIGLPLSGLLGGLVGTFASGYYMRSSIGRIDTDMLNLFFPVLTSLLILRASLAKSERSVLLYSAGSGLSLYFFMWWYNKTGFVLAFFSVLVFILFIKQFRLQTILLSSLLFILCSFPINFLSSASAIQGFLSGYGISNSTTNTLIEDSIDPASFPNTMKTISEVDKVPLETVLKRIISKPILSWAGLLAFFVLVILRWRFLLPLVPILALGLLSFQSSNRFIMFLAPFVGIGLGFLLNLGIEGFFSFLPWKNAEVTDKKKLAATKETKNTSLALAEYKEDKKSQSDKGAKRKFTKNYKLNNLKILNWYSWLRQGSLYFGMVIFFWAISSQTAISFVPAPSIHTGIYKTFFEVKTRVPEDSALLTWWDYGYAITDATGLATFHDGGSQKSPKTYFTARGLISTDPDALYEITQYLATESNRGISENNTSPETLLKAVRNPKHKPWNPIYLFFTADMTGKYGAISKLGSWDIEKGGSKPRAYQNLSCNKITNKEITCHGAKIDLKTGFINNQLTLSRIIFVRNGQVLREQNFGHKRGLTLQLLVVGKNIFQVQLIDEEVFRSNYNQMFLLGRYRKDLFEETYNAFPFSRLYRIKY